NSRYIIQSANDNFSGTAQLTGIGDSIVVKLTDQFGRNDYDTIIVNYFGAPSIYITAPRNAPDTGVYQITLSGTVNNSQKNDSVVIFVNQIFQDTILVAALNGTFIGYATIATPADTYTANTVVVKLIDQFGRTAYDTININFYLPQIDIINPAQDTYTYNPTRNITITYNYAQIGDTIALYNNDALFQQIIVTNNSGQLTSTNFILNSGNNIIKAAITSKITLGTRIDSVIIELRLPEICITFPDDDIDTSSANILIAGTTLNSNVGDTIKIYVNSLTAEQKTVNLLQINGDWQTTINIDTNHGIINSIIAEIKTIYGFTDTDIIYVRKIDKPSIIFQTIPNNNVVDTTSNQILISAEVQNNIGGNTVYIYNSNNQLIYEYFVNINETNFQYNLVIDTSNFSNTDVTFCSYTIVIVNHIGDVVTNIVSANIYPDSWTVYQPITQNNPVITLLNYNVNAPLVIPVSRYVKPYRFIFPVYNPKYTNYPDTYEFMVSLIDKYSDTGVTMIIYP
ncbi:MAG TPA: hypothetical protein PLJ38_09305, partial [bacterium]|nr:hypothetical protein [bacterium]